MTKIVLGTAAWGSKDYGLAKDRPGLRDIRCILKMASEYGINRIHWKAAYADAYGVGEDVLAMIPPAQQVTPPDFYTKDKMQDAILAGATEVSVMYNPLRQYIMPELRNFTGTVYARSIFLQGLLADINLPSPSAFGKQLDRKRDMVRTRAREMNMSMAQYCLAGAFSHPYIDYVILGINTVAHLRVAIEVEKAARHIVFQPEHCLGEHDATDPRCWEVLRDSKPPVEPSSIRKPDQRTTRRVGDKRKSRGRRTRD